MKLPRKLLTALAVPLVILIVVPLAAVAALAFYLLAAAQGFWLLCRSLPRWLRGLRAGRTPRKPHFMETRSATNLGD